jgi:hypothetical protein
MARERSAKAGRPPKAVAQTPRVKRREKSARTAVRKGTMILQTPEGPRALWSGAKPMWKKR